MTIDRCPKDGHSMGWHLFATNVDFQGRVVTNGDVIGCTFGKEESKENYDDNRSRELETGS